MQERQSPVHIPGDRPEVLPSPSFMPLKSIPSHTWRFWVTPITRMSGDDAGGWKRKLLRGKAKGVMRLWNAKRVLTTYQYSGKLSRSSSHQRSSSSFSRSRVLLRSFGTLWGVILLVMGAGREEYFLYEGSVAVTALRTSVKDVLPEACPDLRRECIGATL